MPMKINWDALGITASLACAIHCAVLPLFTAALPLFGINIIHHTGFEITMLLLALFIGLYSLYHGYRRHHHRLLPGLLFTSGIVLLAVKLFLIHDVQNWLLLPAVLLIVSAHFLNYRFCRVHNHAHADDCNH